MASEKPNDPPSPQLAPGGFMEQGTGSERSEVPVPFSNSRTHSEYGFARAVAGDLSVRTLLTASEPRRYPIEMMFFSTEPRTARHRLALGWLVAAAILLLGFTAGKATAEPLEAGMPNPPARPTKVNCAILILDVIDIDDVNESFEAEVALLASWHDPRLAFDAEAEGTPVKIFQGGFQFAEVFQGWWPQLVIINEVGLNPPNAIKIEVYPDGRVRYMEQRNAMLETPMDLHDFPFDTQRLKAVMIPFGNRKEDVILEVDQEFADATNEFVRREKSVNVAGWDLQKLDMAAGETAISVINGSRRFSSMVTTITLKRRSGQIVWVVLFPLVVLVSVVWSIFWVDIDSLPDRLNISFIGVLTIVAYQFVLLEDMPRMSYLTFTDLVLLISFAMMSATIPQSILIHSLVRKGKQREARQIDRTCRWLFPVTYLLLLGGVAFYFLRLT